MANENLERTVIQTGIPSIDALFEQRSLEGGRIGGICVEDSRDATSFCFLGPDGTGKSVLALHMASRYMAKYHASAAKVIYISTDLTHGIANKMWKNFALDYPAERRVPFRYAAEKDLWPSQLCLQEYIPSADRGPAGDRLASYLSGPSRAPSVAFVDLASYTSGDDWGFVLHLLALLPVVSSHRHLVIVDAIEGFEASSGEADSFGEKASRRSRIAQLVRLATHKCHLALISEEPAEGCRLPEQFVADVVVRLRSTHENNYLRRTLEIEKARGQNHVRGRHPYVIRAGGGSTTGRQMNHDDPRVIFKLLAGSERLQSYVHVFHSLHHASRAVMQESGEGKQTPIEAHAGFGIPYLDEMLERGGQQSLAGVDERGLRCGTVSALIGDAGTQKSALGGAFLARTFRPYAEAFNKHLSPQSLSGNILPFQEELASSFAELLAVHLSAGREFKEDQTVLEYIFSEACALLQAPSGARPPEAEKLQSLGVVFEPQRLIEEYRRPRPVVRELLHGVLTLAIKLRPPRCINEVLAAGALAHEDLVKDGGKHPVAVLITTKDDTKRRMIDYFLGPLEREFEPLAPGDTPSLGSLARSAALRAYLDARTIVRRLEVHDMPPALMAHIFQKTIEAAQQLVFFNRADACRVEALPAESIDRARESWRIRLVVDDLGTLMDTFKQVKDDPLFLPYLVFRMGREGVTSLIIDTHPGRPDPTTTEPFHSELRSLTDTRLYTWRVQFYGDNRVAIATIPPVVGEEPRVRVRELVWRTVEGGPRHGTRLLAVDPDFELYSGLEENRPSPVPLKVGLFAETEAFRQYIDQHNRSWSQVFHPVERGTTILENGVRDGMALAPRQAAASSGKPQIFEAVNVFDYDQLSNLCLLQGDMRLDHTLVLQVDEFWGARALRREKKYLTLPADEYSDPYLSFDPDPKKRPKCLSFRDDVVPKITDAATVDRVPFTWDFGFLALRTRAWHEAAQQPRQDVEAGIEDRIETIPKYLKKQDRTVSWRVFCQAAKDVAVHESVRHSKPIVALDVDLPAPEGFSCLLMEVWLSEIYRSQEGLGDSLEPLTRKVWLQQSVLNRSKRSLPAWLGEGKDWEVYHPKELKVKGLRGVMNALRAFRGFSLELYKSWLLLVEVLDLSSLQNEPGTFGLRVPHMPDPTAVAVRHWYKTAAMADAPPDGDSFSYVPMPGHFTTRGDWYLGVAPGSRSNRLADRTLDLMCSVPENMARLRMGLGLPTRKLSPDAEKMIHTRLVQEASGLRDAGRSGPAMPGHLTLEKLIALGANKANHRYWLFRSGLENYDRHVLIWQRWLYRMLRRWHKLRDYKRHLWVPGFTVYDEITRILNGGDVSEESAMRLIDLESLHDFPGMCADLVQELSQTEP